MVITAYVNGLKTSFRGCTVKLDMRLGDCLDVLPTLEAGSVHCCVTSPPYWGLRDYGTATWEGGDADCDHAKDRTVGVASSGLEGGKATTNHQHEASYRHCCGKCGARRIDSQLGLEATPEEYVAKMVEVFRAVKRVLRDDGTLWLNLGDFYTSTGLRGFFPWIDLKPKDLVGMPWRVAFALQADGWYLRSDIIWHKPNPMPESCTDRPTKSHEYVFLLTKSAKYFYDADAIREDSMSYGRQGSDRPAAGSKNDAYESQGMRHAPDDRYDIPGRNKRSVWTIATQPYAKAHFATFPEALVLPCILAGTSEEGCCAECGAPYVRVTEREQLKRERPNDRTNRHEQGEGVNSCGNTVAGVDVKTIGWEASCKCVVHNADLGPFKITQPGIRVVPCTVLDPFLGSGTTAKVSQQYGRSFVGCELSPEYLELARDRFKQPRLFS